MKACIQEQYRKQASSALVLLLSPSGDTGTGSNFPTTFRIAVRGACECRCFTSTLESQHIESSTIARTQAIVADSSSTLFYLGNGLGTKTVVARHAIGQNRPQEHLSLTTRSSAESRRTVAHITDIGIPVELSGYFSTGHSHIRPALQCSNLQGKRMHT